MNARQGTMLARLGAGLMLLLMGAGAMTTNAQEIALTFDNSGSMRGDRIIAARAAAIQVINELPATTWLSIRAYNTCNTTRRMTMRQMTPANKQTARNIINSLGATEGRTPLARGILDARSDFLGNRGRQTIVAITDGEENCGGDVLQAARSTGTAVILNIVGIQLSARLTQPMTQAATAGGGRYYPSNNLNQLLPALRGAVGGGGASRTPRTLLVNGPNRLPPNRIAQYNAFLIYSDGTAANVTGQTVFWALPERTIAVNFGGRGRFRTGNPAFWVNARYGSFYGARRVLHL